MQERDLAFYGAFAPALAETEQFLLSQIYDILDGISTDSETALAEHVKSRIKSADSLCAKLARKGLPLSARSGIEALSDVIGLRVVTHFIGDIYTIVEKLKQSTLWSVVTLKDYIAMPKPNGYRSLHVILQLPFTGLSYIRAEIQLRTIAMDCWASLEHQLKYKKDIKNTALIVSELKRCADEMASTDLTMQTIRDLIWKDRKI